MRVMSAQTENLAKNKIRYQRWIGEIDRVIHEIAINGTASASISSSGGAKSYSRIDVEKLLSIRAEYVERMLRICRALRAGSSPAGIRRVMTVRCG
jgi:hypothetical protein